MVPQPPSTTPATPLAVLADVWSVAGSLYPWRAPLAHVEGFVAPIAHSAPKFQPLVLPPSKLSAKYTLDVEGGGEGGGDLGGGDLGGGERSGGGDLGGGDAGDGDLGGGEDRGGGDVGGGETDVEE